jgi:hypothetical protein
MLQQRPVRQLRSMRDHTGRKRSLQLQRRMDRTDMHCPGLLLQQPVQERRSVCQPEQQLLLSVSERLLRSVLSNAGEPVRKQSMPERRPMYQPSQRTMHMVYIKSTDSHYFLFNHY